MAPMGQTQDGSHFVPWRNQAVKLRASPIIINQDIQLLNCWWIQWAQWPQWASGPIATYTLIILVSVSRLDLCAQKSGVKSFCDSDMTDVHRWNLKIQSTSNGFCLSWMAQNDLIFDSCNRFPFFLGFVMFVVQVWEVVDMILPCFYMGSISVSFSAHLNLVSPVSGVFNCLHTSAFSSFKSHVLSSIFRVVFVMILWLNVAHASAWGLVCVSLIVSFAHAIIKSSIAPRNGWLYLIPESLKHLRYKPHCRRFADLHAYFKRCEWVLIGAMAGSQASSFQ